jgi:hypothetical protein
MIKISRAEILEILESKTLKVIRATVDPRTCENYTGDRIPHPGGIAILLQAGDDPDDLLMVAYDDQVARQATAGEHRVYSYDQDLNVLASVYCNKDSEVVINDGQDWAVQFSALKSAFEELRDDHNALLSEYKTHIHGGVLAGDKVTLATVSTQLPSTADISPAKVDKIRIP